MNAWLRGFMPPPIIAGKREKLYGCLGACIGLLLAQLSSKYALGDLNIWFVAPMGASAVLLFAVPSSPLAQPWSIIGGNLVSATIGVTCARFIGDPMLAASAAGALAIGAMFGLRCLHPPSGAVALTAVLGGPAVHAAGYDFVFWPVGVNSLFLLLAALAFNNALGRRYPHAPASHAQQHGTKDVPPIDRLGFTLDDLDAVLKEQGQIVDVSRDDLAALFMQTEMHAYRRRFGEITCGDIMSRDVITAEFGTTLEEAWMLMRRHHIKALPVINRARRVIGIVTLMDFMRHANLDIHAGFDAKLRKLIRRTLHTHSDKPEVIGQIMTSTVQAVHAEMHIVELVPMLSNQGKHHVPVVDDEGRLVGMLTQSDLIGALYRGRLADTTAAA
ncbi:HPP family protein [Paucimonas lemoignei]|uniref:HPP family protein n=1 Tax=Paucimonas lemoignei TaxID=29443 RepID=UPI001FB38D6F|nr:HPP family protein [Paucimonas lemoignei]